MRDGYVMTVHPNPRLPARTDGDELLLDRPAPQQWRAARSYEDRTDERPAVISPAPRPATPVDVLSRGIVTLIKLTVLLILLAVL